MKKYITPLSLASALLITSCAKDEVNAPKDDSEKTAIEFSMTDNNTAKAAVSGQARTGFNETTGIVMRMEATNATDATQSKYTRTMATAETGTNYSTLSFSDGGTNTRYWDDAYGRNTLLSIYAVAVPDKTGIIAADALKGDNTWSTEVDNTLSWTVGTTQTTESISNKDLVYSNNIQSSFTEYNKKNGVYEYNFTSSTYPTFDGSDFSVLTPGQMKFRLKNATVTDGPGKFDKGNLNFVHALSRITLNVVLGEGFTGTNTISNVKMLAMPQTGTFNIKDGVFSGTTASDINMATMTANSKYIGQVLPGYVFTTGSETNVLQFEVADNLYYVTQNSIYNALNIEANQPSLKFTDATNGIEMQQGQNYILTVTVNKTKIDKITATLAEWTNLSGEFERNNAYLSFSFSNYGGTDSKNFSLYRSASAYTDYVVGEPYEKHYDWDANYAGNIATLTAPEAGSSIWKTNWLWDDNKTFYHLRMVGTDGTTARTISTDAGKEYFDITAGTTDGNYRWGAPMISGKTLQYDLTNGFDYSTTDHHISHAIGATNDEIHLTEVNMLSHIKVYVKTTTGDNKVTLYDGSNMTKVSLTHIYTNGKVYMGNGLATATGSRATSATAMTSPAVSTASTNAISGSYDYYVVPQALVDDATYVGLTIQTPDNNIYYVVEKLSTITASSVTNGTNVSIGQAKNDAITYWYPNCCYTYTITLSKAGIDKLTATLVPYTEITGETDITIED